jgi:hypothetical protein
MDITYKIIGTDGREYGPIGLEQIKAWVTEGRLNRDTQVWRSDTNAWASAAQYMELGMPPAAAAPVLPPAAQASLLRLMRQVRIGADWFFWVAGLSVLNSVLVVSGAGIRFIFGLGVTRVIDGIASGQAGQLKMLGLVADLVAAGVLVTFGIFARQRQTWSFITGMLLYALDGVVLVLFSDWIGVAVHAYVLFRIYMGMQASMELNKLEAGLEARRP